MKIIRILVWSALIVTAAGVALAAPPSGQAHRAKPRAVKGIDNSQHIDINNISMAVTNHGSFAYDNGSGNAGLEFPKGTGKTAVFAAGLWLGAKFAGSAHVTVSEYSDEYGPGAMLAGGAADDPTKPEYKVYKLFKNYDDPAVRDAALADYNSGAVPHGAPPVVVNTDGSLSVLGDQMLWSVYNDANATNHTNRAGSTAPLGIEVQQTTFAFHRQGALDNSIFVLYRLINKGTNTLDSMFVSQWMDPDLGGFTDDLVGCDTTLGIGFVYNSSNNDQVYATTPPSLGVDFFKGPINVLGDTLHMASFNKYINGTDPNTFLKSYHYMEGLDADGNIVINPVSGQPTQFQVSGDPVLGIGWLDTNPADRRMMLSSGPFRMAPGDTQTVAVALVVGQSLNRLASISKMEFYDQFAQAAFNANFNLPSPPQSPKVTTTPRDGSIFISWDTRAETYNQPPYNFEGYVVYQGASVAGPWTRVATWDKVNGITTVLDLDFDEIQGLILPKGAAFGQDVGLRYQMELTQDAIKGGPLFVGQTYYYTVTAYSVGLGQFPQVLESAFNPITVVPQTPPAGVNLGSAVITPLVQTERVAGPSPTTDAVTVTVVDAANVITANYEVGFKPPCATCAGRVWYVVRHVGAVVDTVVNNWPNFSADDATPVFDGIQVRIKSYPLGQLGLVAYADTAGGNPTPFGGVDRGLPFYEGGGGYSADDVGSSIPSGTLGPNITVRMTAGVPSFKAYRYERDTPATGTVYALKEFTDVPFEAYDSANPSTHYATAFLESQGAPTNDHIWNPDDSGNGGREGIFVFNMPYTDTIDNAFFTDPGNQDMLAGNLPIFYEVFARRLDPTTIIDAGDAFKFVTSIPSTPNDLFTFSTTAPNLSDATNAKNEMKRIMAVPNPYFAHSTYELNQFNRILKFTHLPATCTIRIFNLSGDLVRTMQKSDQTSQATWDLLTDRGLPVGSGIYIFHVDAPGFGTHVGKLAVFMEKERLNNF